jgi:hypothetical protein
VCPDWFWKPSAHPKFLVWGEGRGEVLNLRLYKIFVSFKN